VAKRRDAIRMTDDELWSFVAEQRSLQVATINRDGTPHLSTLWFAVVDGAIAFETFTKSQKVRNLERDPRITVLLEDGDVYHQLRGVTMSGVAELRTEPADVLPVALAVGRRNAAGIPGGLLEDTATRVASKRTAILVRPHRITSWDHRKLGGTY
jgi:PPOX class probable F420-dependent enzyme